MFTTKNIGISIRRCAVCRIDLKGRFVFVDDGIEQLMGFTREELFGKPFIDFVDEPDQALVLGIIRQHSRYEMNFDSVQVRLLNRAKESISATAIIAMNFIAGNPVNYQVIIDTGRSEAYEATEPKSDTDYAKLVEELLTMPTATPEACLEAIYGFVGADCAVMYKVVNNQPEPMFSRSSGQQSSIRVLPVPKKLLRWVAESDEEYSVADADQVRRAIERAGVAPGEFICKFKLGADAFLLRMMCDESPNPNETRERIASVRLALRLAERLYGGEGTEVLSAAPNSTVLDELRASLSAAMKSVAMLYSKPQSGK